MSNSLFFQFQNHPNSGMGFQTNFNSGDLEVYTNEKSAALQVKLSDSQLSVAVTPPAVATPQATLRTIFKPKNFSPPPLLLLPAPTKQKRSRRHESSSSSAPQVHYTSGVAKIEAPSYISVTDTSYSRKYPGGFNLHDPNRSRRGHREWGGTGSAETTRVLASHPEDLYRLGRYQGRDQWNILAQRVQDLDSVSASTSEDERDGRRAGYEPRWHHNDARARSGVERGRDGYGGYRDPRYRVWR